MKWITALNETMDGNTLIIYPPMLVNENRISNVNSADEFSSPFKIYIIDDLIIHLKSTYINDNLKDSIKMFKKDLEESIKWMRDDNCAPPSNPQIYDDKCVEALYDLREKYSDEFPEMFI